MLNKALVIGITESMLEQPFWTRIESQISELKFVAKESPEIMQELPSVDCLLINFGIEIKKEHIDLAPNLKYIGILATAFGKVDVAYAKEKGITVTHLPGYSTESVAEFTIAAILEQIRGLHEGKERGKTGNYSEAGMKAMEIRGKKFGVIGLGSIGTRVAEIAQGFGAHVQYWSQHRKPEQEAKGIKYTELNELLGSSDFISINLAQAAETEGMFGSKQFNLLKKGVLIINTAPMELINIEALGAALTKGGLTFILDHSDEMSQEDLTFLSKWDDCVIYPPIAYITEEARVAKQEMFTNNLEGFVSGNPINTLKD